MKNIKSNDSIENFIKEFTYGLGEQIADLLFLRECGNQSSEYLNSLTKEHDLIAQQLNIILYKSYLASLKELQNISSMDETDELQEVCFKCRAIR